MAKDHLHDFFLWDIASEQQSDRFGYCPTVFAQQPFPEQSQMFVSAFVLEITDINPHIAIAHVDREDLEIVTFFVETAAAFQIETTSVPITGENAVTNSASGQRVTHMRALVICGVYPAIDVE
jgi:hypothetical protein